MSAQLAPTGGDLPGVLAKAAAYVAAYETRFSLLVAEERYQQTMTTSGGVSSSGANISQSNPGGGMQTSGGATQRRSLRSDYLLAWLGSGAGWVPFRDVFEVDGRRVTDRDDRLTKLFLSPSASTFDTAMRIMADSTRHNVGSLSRTISIPILGLMFLHPDVQGRFDVTRNGSETIDTVEYWVLTLRERELPFLIRTQGGGLPATVTVWLQPATGLVAKTNVAVKNELLDASVTTTYRAEPKLGFWVPERMDETYRTNRGAETIKGTATYERFRQFTVNTDEALRKPPPR